jgi:hypothetical protein
MMKSVLQALFPFVILWKYIRPVFATSIALHMLTLALPISATCMLLIWSVLGLHAASGFLETLRTIWVGFYWDGILLGITAWRWHLAIFTLILILNTIDEYAR